MGTGRLTVEVVEGRRSHEAFWRFPWDLYRGDPLWVAPLRGDERRRWDEASNPALAGRWHQRYLARRDGRVVGRVAASTDSQFQSRWEERTGFFGFFECEDDAEAARALLDAAAAALKGRGLDLALGPVNLSMHDESGVLVDGFDTPPKVLSPYNPRYVPTLLEAAGCRPRLEFCSYLWTPAQQPHAAAQSLLEASRRSGRVRVRPVNLARFEDECRLLLDLYNDSFRDLWGFVPMSADEFRARAKSFRPFLNPELILVLEVDGRAEGFCLALPDIHAALRPLRGRLWPFGWLHLMRAAPRLDSARVLLLGLRPQLTGRGNAVLLCGAIDEAARRCGMREVELSVVQARNAPMRHLIDAFGTPQYKSYRLYERRCNA